MLQLHKCHVIYSFQYYDRFHATAVVHGAYYPWIRGHYCTYISLQASNDYDPNMNTASVFYDVEWRCCVQEVAHKALAVSTDTPSQSLRNIC
jgi:hypothetical protein